MLTRNQLEQYSAYFNTQPSVPSPLPSLIRVDRGDFKFHLDYEKVLRGINEYSECGPLATLIPTSTSTSTQSSSSCVGMYVLGESRQTPSRVWKSAVERHFQIAIKQIVRASSSLPRFHTRRVTYATANGNPTRHRPCFSICTFGASAQRTPTDES